MTLRNLVKDFCPPILVRAIRRSHQIRKKPHILDPNLVPAENFTNPWISEEWLTYSNEKLTTTRSTPKTLTYLDVLTCFLNGTSQPRLKVLDWAGGTGFVHFAIRDRLTVPVEWLVSDNDRLADLGRQFAAANPSDVHSVRFIPLEDVGSIDALIVNTSLQYVEDGGAMMRKLADMRPERIALLRLLVAERDRVQTFQTFSERTGTICNFHSKIGIINALTACGYRLMLDIPNYDESAAIVSALSAEFVGRLGPYPSQDLYFVRS